MHSLLAAFVNERVNRVRQTEEVQARSIFLRIVSHELRTPIHGILASTEILHGSRLTFAQRSLISAIESAGTHWNSQTNYCKLNDKPTNLFTIEFYITGIGRILSDLESYIKRADLIESYSELHSGINGIRFAKTLVTITGGNFKLMTSSRDPKSHEFSHTFIITIDLQKTVEEIVKLMKIFEMQMVQRIFIEKIDNKQINTMIFDTSELEDQLIEEVCQRAKSASVMIICITKMLRNIVISDIAAKSGIHGDKIYLIGKQIEGIQEE
ncbi:hypothetical protein C1645_821445 [Glomus cerebriforme]|uniref:Signal transduction histidine kinase dimerisation/phosphoacceptor domain-containing protein n=1 Tax=Glomus cerebriforme TaxID=658196 RepID=A0A397T142_9GLOM|nr:hypothetical protein C1645_821445 [Glomus cerebriforme]